MRYLAIDFGERRIGLAVCDAGETIVSPLARIDRRDDTQAVERIAATADAEGAGALVIGLPVNMDGTEGPAAERVRRFAELLAGRCPLPIHFQNEQLSSFAADGRLAGRELTRARKKARQDAIAAAVILEDFLARSRGS